MKKVKIKLDNEYFPDERNRVLGSLFLQFMLLLPKKKEKENIRPENEKKLYTFFSVFRLKWEKIKIEEYKLNGNFC